MAVDGAHAIGQVDIDLSALRASGVDYYTSNCHKWLYCPSGSAFMWVSRDSPLYGYIQPAVLSLYEQGDLYSRFGYVATRDYSPFCVIPAAFDFIDSVGGMENVHAYLNKLARYAGATCARIWQTETLVPVESDLIGAMVDVRLPTDDLAVAQSVREKLDKEHDVYIVVYELYGKVWTRLSAAIYLEESDFDFLAHKVLSQFSQTCI